MTNKQNQVYNYIKNKKDIKITIRINPYLYCDILDICEKRHISVSQCIRQMISNDIKHPSYNISDNIINEFKKIWSK